MAWTRRLLAYLACAVVLFTLSACGQSETKPKAEPVVAAEGELIAVNQPSAGNAEELYTAYDNALFIGDSRIEGFRLHSGVKKASFYCAKSLTVDKIADGDTVNIDGQQISVHDRLSATDYDKVIISVGLNELGWNHIEDFISEYRSLIKLVKEKQPEAAIYVQALLPVTAEKSEEHDFVNNSQIYWYNLHIIEMAEEEGVKYVNAAPAVVDDKGNLAAEATTDGVHLNKEFCRKWAEYLAGLL